MARYELAGRVVAITGSTGGLGDALATKLRERGAYPASARLTPQKLRHTFASSSSPAERIRPW